MKRDKTCEVMVGLELRGTDNHVIFISFSSFGDFLKAFYAVLNVNISLTLPAKNRIKAASSDERAPAPWRISRCAAVEPCWTPMPTRWRWRIPSKDL